MKILIPTPLRQFTDKTDTIEVKANTVGEGLQILTSKYPDLRKHLFTDDGRMRSFVNVYLNNEDIRYLSNENTPVKSNDTVLIVPSVAGGVLVNRQSSYR